VTIWIRRDVVLAIHDEQVAEHGGRPGLRDAGLPDSALARPMTAAAYGEPDVPALAAAYAYGLARNHPFLDGNKRTALVVAQLFLELNGWRLAATDAECVLTFVALAAGEVSEPDLADWFRRHARPG
jgi:death-on-curing protein